MKNGLTDEGKPGWCRIMEIKERGRVTEEAVTEGDESEPWH